MNKKDIDIEKEMERLKTAKPSILRCSYAMSRKIKKRKRLLAMLDPTLAEFVYSIAIKPVGGIPDHIVFLCDDRGRTIKMINLTLKPIEKPIVLN